MGEHVTKSPLEFGVIVCLDRQEILVNMVSVLYQCAQETGNVGPIFCLPSFL